jgi:hypothetical protein
MIYRRNMPVGLQTQNNSTNRWQSWLQSKLNIGLEITNIECHRYLVEKRLKYAQSAQIVPEQ